MARENISKDAIIKWINKRIKISERFLEYNETCFEDVINNEDTDDYSEESENNNFEAGAIGALKELKEEIQENKINNN